MFRRMEATRRDALFTAPFVLFALAIIAFGAVSLIVSEPRSWTLIFAVIAGVIICGPFQMRIGRGVGAPIVGVAVSMLALPPVATTPLVDVSVWASGLLLSQLFLRRRPLRALYLTGLSSAGALLFVNAEAALTDLGVWPLLSLLIATAAYYLVFVVGELVRRSVRGTPNADPGQPAVSPGRAAWIVLVVTATAELMRIADSTLIPWLEREPDASRTPFVIVLAASSFYVLAQRSRYSDIERRLSAVVDASVELPRATGSALAAALEARAREIVQAGDVELRSAGPGRGEIGVPVSLEPGTVQHLIASDKAGGVSFSRDDERAIATLAHVASEAARIQFEVDSLERRANSDPLTGLPNYGAFQRALTDANENRPFHDGIALLFIDLDNFKKLNDNYGHRAGDELLCAVADRLRRTAGGGDFVSRVGGDEFVVILTGLHSLDQAKDSADRIVAAVSERLPLEGRILRPVVSAGLAFSSHREIDAQTLVEDADRTMLQAKRSRRRDGALQHSSVSISSHRSTRTNDIVARAIREDRLVLAFQPIVDVASREIWAFEALVRYMDPELGPISPPSLVARAKGLGLMNDLTRQVVTKALDAAEEFRRLEPTIACMTVNLELGQIDDAELGPFIRESARAHPDISMCVELNERSLRSVTEDLRREAERLLDSGVLLALDDYGSDDSSVGALVHFPMNILKLDKSLINDLTDARQREVVKALQGYSDNLGYTMIVEGIETPAMVDVMTDIGVGSAQGYYFGRPLLFDRTVQRLKHSGTRAVID